MANIKAHIVNDIPSTLTESGLYFTKHPLNPDELVVSLATEDGSEAKTTRVTSPIESMSPSLYDSVELVYDSQTGDLTEKVFKLGATTVGTQTFIYSGSDLSEKRLYISGAFVGKVTYTYSSGEFVSKAYSTVI